MNECEHCGKDYCICEVAPSRQQTLVVHLMEAIKDQRALLKRCAIKLIAIDLMQPELLLDELIKDLVKEIGNE